MTPRTGRNDPIPLVLTGAGSLVGRCLLDSLAGRRERLLLIGADLAPDGPTVAECDVRVAVPPSKHPDFVPAVEMVVERFGAQLVIPCRDPDALALAPAAERPDSPIRIPGARAELVAVARDKWLSYCWCRERGIPFAPTVCTDHLATAELADVSRWAFPLIAKPRAGSGSLGVRVLRTPDQLSAALQQPGYVIQPFLDPPAPAQLELDTSAGVPLFWEVPVRATPAVMLVIGPAGTAMPPLCFAADHRLGRVERVQRLLDPQLERFAQQLLDSFRAAGWQGPLSVPLRRSNPGEHPARWAIIELNPRFSGGTSARLLLGFDEVGWVINTWLGQPVVPAHPARPTRTVTRILADHPV